MTESDVAYTTHSSFPCESVGKFDGLRPQDLKGMIGAPAGESGSLFLSVLTPFSSFVLSGKTSVVLRLRNLAAKFVHLTTLHLLCFDYFVLNLSTVVILIIVNNSTFVSYKHTSLLHCCISFGLILVNLLGFVSFCSVFVQVHCITVIISVQ